MPRISTSVDTTVDVEVEIEIYCASCGAGLCNISSVSKTARRPRNAIDVEACPKCLDRARDDGYEKGYEAARKEFERSN